MKYVTPLGVLWVLLDIVVLSRFSRVWLFETLRTVAHQAPPSKGFSRQEHLHKKKINNFNVADYIAKGSDFLITL